MIKGLPSGSLMASFQAIIIVKHRAILMSAYAADLRVLEVVALRVEDIDWQRMIIRVRQGRGRTN
jgi:site-specific recombinase XerD